MATNDQLLSILAQLVLRGNPEALGVQVPNGQAQVPPPAPAPAADEDDEDDGDYDEEEDEDEEDEDEDMIDNDEIDDLIEDQKKHNKNSRKQKGPPGMTCEIKNLYQKLDKNHRLIWVNEYPDDLQDPVENSETAKFALIVRNKKSYDPRKKLEVDSIILQSPLLKKALQPVLKDYPGVTLTLERLTFSAPFAPFVHRWNQFLTALEEAEEGSVEKSHMTLLHSVLEAELSDVIATKKDHVANGVITFGHMWTIFEPGALVYSTDVGHERVYELNNTGTSTDQMAGVDFLNVNCWGVDWDGNKFGKAIANLRNYEFDGTMKITDLKAFPLEFHPEKERLIRKLTARGKIFEKYAGYQYMAYKGVALGYGQCGMIKHSVDSRIIIDTEAHNKFNPNRAVSYSSLPRQRNNATLPGLTPTTSDSDSEVEYSDYDEEEETNTKALSASNGPINTPTRRVLTPRELIMTVPYVRGYALKTKKWLWFFVSEISAIKFNTDAFSSLVLPSSQKDLIHAFVQSQITNKDEFDDIISGKGRGMILLLSGPPGVGKTLTAESVAEKLQVPLYMMSAGDLGLDPSKIESSLNTILEMVAKWGAVLLLDEADVFLEARSSSGHDLERNKMVSIFLRVLEYYEGILFLTTNRIKNIDEAFHSRIHITMQYPSLTRESRKHIWTTFIGARQFSSSSTTEAPTAAGFLTEAEIDALSTVEINGRQIKNVIKTARMLARAKTGTSKGDGVLTIDHIKTVLNIERDNAWNEEH